MRNMKIILYYVLFWGSTLYVWRFKTEIVISGINNGFKDISLIDGNVRLIMSIYGNGDLYWTIMDDSKLIKNMFFTITRENGAVYSIFQDLFADIENANVCTLDDDIFNNYETENIIKYIMRMLLNMIFIIILNCTI